MNQDIQDTYRQAAFIVNKAPPGAAALLRLCVQKLYQQLGQPGKNLNKDIGALVEEGLPPTVQKALDTVRVLGNEAVHPGTIDLMDDRTLANKLIKNVNLIARIMITQPKEIDELHDKIPETSKE